MDEEIKLFKQEKKTFDEERRKFTETAIKLGQEVSYAFSLQGKSFWFLLSQKHLYNNQLGAKF